MCLGCALFTANLDMILNVRGESPAIKGRAVARLLRDVGGMWHKMAHPQVILTCVPAFIRQVQRRRDGRRYNSLISIL